MRYVKVNSVYFVGEHINYHIEKQRNVKTFTMFGESYL